ncbi:hypothetical protein ACIQU5_32815 [Streptomyces sp. NPDC090306]|uniref:hypothetical protein n=1 Tax=unclassified Streptomyces TaxID=2593676 RepID=UPI0036E21F2A
MMHRGRHRRRRRGRALRAVLGGAAFALTAAATMISASQATSSDDPGALKPLTSATALDRFQLQEDLVPAATLDRLASSMGRPVGIATVLASPDHTLRDTAGCTAAEREALPAEPAPDRAYCWADGDAATSAWLPRAVTTSGDADGDGSWGEHRVLLSGWTHNDRLAGTTGADRGLTRVAVVDADDPSRLTYSWVLLAVPVDGGRDYAGLVSHVAGMVWYQDKLLVTTTSGSGEALYVYDVNRVQRADVNSAAVGRSGKGWSAHGYRWVMPAVGAYRMTGGTCTPAADDAVPCLGGLSLDRGTSPDSLVASESVPAGSGRHTRLWRYPFSTDPARPGLLAADGTGQVDAGQAYETKASGVRAVLSRTTGTDTEWYVGPASDGARRGTLWRQDTEGAKAAKCGARDGRRCWSPDVRSLSYWTGTGEVWSQSGRTLFATPLAAIDRALR